MLLNPFCLRNPFQDENSKESSLQWVFWCILCCFLPTGVCSDYTQVTIDVYNYCSSTDSTLNVLKAKIWYSDESGIQVYGIQMLTVYIFNKWICLTGGTRSCWRSGTPSSRITSLSRQTTTPTIALKNILALFFK